jgi:hypothetical protein
VLANEKGTPFEVPDPLEPPHEQQNYRNQFRGHKAPEAETIDCTARLAGFEIKDHFHGTLRLSSMHAGPLM